MKKELTDYLDNRFGHLFGPGFYGFSCSNGWYDILANLLEKIEDVVSDKEITFKLGQVKEKFGTLRFYYSPLDKDIDALVVEAEQLSSKTCEACGAPGERDTDHGWVKTLCLSCVAKRAKYGPIWRWEEEEPQDTDEYSHIS